MNSISFRFLTAALMGVVFVCGFLSGRLTAPSSILIEASPVVDSEPNELGNVNQRVINRYTEDLELSREQLRILRPMFETTGKRMLRNPKNSEARLHELERFHAEINPHLTDMQQVKAREMLENAIRMKRVAIESAADR